MSRKKMSVKDQKTSKQMGTLIINYAPSETKNEDQEKDMSSTESLKPMTIEEIKAKYPNDEWVYDEPVK